MSRIAKLNKKLKQFARPVVEVLERRVLMSTVTLGVADGVASETGPDNGTFQIGRAWGDRTGNLEVNYTVTGTATQADYTQTLTGVAVIPDGIEYTIVTITPVNDALVEGSETVILTLQPGGYTMGATTTGTATIYDNDTASQTVTVTATDSSASETGPDNGVIRFSRGAYTTGDVTVNYTVGGTATNGTDFSTLSGTAVISNGSTYVDVTVSTVNDSDIENSETVVVTLDYGTTYNRGTPNTATVTITDNDLPSVTISAMDAAAAEAASDPGVFRITRSGTGLLTQNDLAVTYTISGTADQADYSQTLTGVATIAAGSSSVDVTITPIDDSDIENAETVVVTLTTGSGYTLGGQSAGTVTITDNDLPVVTITAVDASADEMGSDPGVFRITRSGTGPLMQNDLTVTYTISGTAVQADYTQTLTGVATIAGGSTSVDVTITPIDDASSHEPDETVILTISTNAAYTRGASITGTVTILDSTADTWYVRPYAGAEYTYGSENGTSYANAWDGLGSIGWGTGGVSAGDTLYVCGMHPSPNYKVGMTASHNNQYLVVGATGISEDRRITIRGDYDGDPGTVIRTQYQVAFDINNLGGTGWTQNHYTTGGYDFYYYTQNLGSKTPNPLEYNTSTGTLTQLSFAKATPAADPSKWTGDGVAFHDPASPYTYFYKPSAGVTTSRVYLTNAVAGAYLDGRDYVTIKNMSYRGGTTQDGLVYLTNGSDHALLDNLDIRYSGYCGIKMDRKTSTVADGAPCNYGEIKNCYIERFTTGIYFVSPSVRHSDWWVHNNNIRNGYQQNEIVADGHGIQLEGGNDHLIEYNIVEHVATDPVGVDMKNGTPNNNIVIRYNWFNDASSNPARIDNYTFGMSGSDYNPDNNANNMVYGNVFKGGAVQGMHGSGFFQPAATAGDQWNVFNNLILESSHVASHPQYSVVTAFYMGESTTADDTRVGGVKFFNNILADSEHAHMTLRTLNGAGSNYTIDYNLYDAEGTDKWYAGYYGSPATDHYYSTLAAWQAGQGKDLHSPAAADPKFIDTTGTNKDDFDLRLQWDSSGIDAGAKWWDSLDILAHDGSVMDYTDLNGLPIYGTPDIGPYEYQPPYVMGTDDPKVGTKVRLYGDGKFRNLEAAGANSADLTVAPAAGWGSWTSTQERPFWADVEVETWGTSGTYYRKWTVDDGSNDWNNYATTHTIGGLTANASYRLTVGGAEVGRYAANSSGVVTFTYTGGNYNNLAFELQNAGTDWYVRPYGGAYGAEDGSSYANAFDGFPDITWGSIAAGDTIWLCGEFHLAGSNNLMTVGASGSAGNPISIRGDHPTYPLTAWVGAAARWTSGWTQASADLGQNVWYRTNGNPLQVMEEMNVRLSKATAAPTSVGPWTTAGQWFWDSGATRLYYKPSDSTGANSHVVSSSIGSTMLDLAGCDYIAIQGLTMRNSWTTGGTILLNDADYVTIDNCTFEYNYETLDIKGSSDNGAIRNNTFNDVGYAIHMTDSSAGNDYWTISGNTIHDVNDEGYYGDVEAAMGCGMSLETGNNNLIEKNTIYNVAAAGIRFWHASGASLHVDNNVVRYNFIRDVAKSSGSNPEEVGIFFNADNAYTANNSTGNQVYGNIVTDVTNAGLRNDSQSPASGNSWVWYNNTVYDAGYGYEFDDNPNGSVAFLFKNNLLSTPVSKHVDHLQKAGETRTGVVMDYNLYDADSGTKFEWNGTDYSFANWKTNSGQDANSPTPAAANLANGSGNYTAAGDFQLSWNSPAIDTGVKYWASGDVTDYAGNPIYGTPDIGAYEYQPPYTMAPAGNDLLVGTKVRVYQDGKYRNIEAAGANAADLAVEPAAGWTTYSATALRPFWADVEAETWGTGGTYYRRWTVDDGANNWSGYATKHTIGGLGSMMGYKITVGGTALGVYRSDGNGRLSFTYTGSNYDNLAFELERVSIVTLSCPDSTAYEAGSDTGTFRITRDYTVGALEVAYSTCPSTAASANDYTPTLPMSVTIADGSSSVDIVITPVDDASVESDENLKLQLTTSSSGYYATSNNYGTVTIIDNDTTVTISAVDASAAEAGSDVGVFRITRSGTTTNAMTVTYTKTGSTVQGDYGPTLSGAAVIPAGSTTVDITITPVDDALVEGSETVILTLQGGNNYTVGGQSAATVTIADNDSMLAAQVNPNPQAGEVIERVGHDMIQQAIVNAAAERGLTISEASNLLADMNVVIVDLGTNVLGGYSGNTVFLDDNASGYGWFVDATPETSEEFTWSSSGVLTAKADSDAAGKMDLLTVLTHEIGHLLGLGHSTDSMDVMFDVLAASSRLGVA